MTQFHNDFNKQFKSIQRTAYIGMGVSFLLSITVVGGLGWAIWKLVTHFTQ
jgi:nitrate reductase NapE component